MRGMFHRHLAATAVTLAVIGGASAQSSVILTSQHSDTPPSATSTISPATEPAAAPAAAPETKPATGADLLQAPIAENLQGNDAAIAEKLRELLATKLNRVIERKQDRAGVEAFYRDRGFAPLWIADGKALRSRQGGERLPARRRRRRARSCRLSGARLLERCR